MIDGEMTLKWFYREKVHIRLQPANPNMGPIIICPEAGEVSIVGKVIGVYPPQPTLSHHSHQTQETAACS
jgi:repressor LexA